MIELVELTPNEEIVLKEILEHRLENGLVDNNYWDNRFETVTGQDEWTLRSILGSLKDKGKINIPQWPDGKPEIFLKNEALEYFNVKELNEIEKKKEERKSLRKDILLLVGGALLGYLFSNLEKIITLLKILFNGGV